ncbi:MAG: superoxide dismutase [Gammaproteobacteria bacterium]
MPYELKPLSCDPAKLSGLSEKLIVSHWKNNYGAVKRLNAIEGKLAELDWASAPVFVVNGLKREELIATGSMILHEVYFDSLGGTGGEPSGALKAAIERDFGSADAWCAEFTAMGRAQGGGSGWTLLAWSPRRNRLVNVWAADHAHNLAGAVPLIALDMYEHSYHMDFGAKAVTYVDAFMQNLSWKAAEAAFTKPGA